MLSSGLVLKERYAIVQVLRQNSLCTIALARDRRSHELLPFMLAYSTLHPESISASFLPQLPRQSPGQPAPAAPPPENGLKLIKGVVGADERLFELEGRLLTRLEHPALMRITDYFTWGPVYYIVMEHLPGISLAEHLAQEPSGYLSERETQAIILPLLDGLEYIYNRVFMHFTHGFIPAPGAITPHDVHITPEQKVALVFSHLWTGGSNGQPVARVRPLRPELYLSIGTLLYTMLRGTAPPDIAERRNGAPLAPLRGHNLSVSPPMEQIVLRLLALNPADRYSSMDELRHDLQQVGQEPPAPAARTRTRQPSHDDGDVPTNAIARRWLVVSIITALVAIVALIAAIAGLPVW